MPDQRTPKTITETCHRCNGSGRYSFNLRDGDKCYGCMGAGTITRTVAQVNDRARRAAARAKREAAAAQSYADAAALSGVVIDRLLAAWGDDFTDIAPEWRHAHVVQKAQRALRDMGVRVDTYVGALLPHLDSLGV